MTVQEGQDSVMGLLLFIQTASQALGDWYFERDTTASSVIDCAYPCNPTCPPKTSGRLSVGRPSFRNWSKRQ